MWLLSRQKSLIEKKISQKLTEIATAENIQFLLAVESGSRAWGFPSLDSDYDVRAIFIRPQEEYLRIFDCAADLSFIEDSWFDVSCWDIRKAFRLILKSNMTLFEWLQSPIIYHAETRFQAEILSIAQEYFQPTAAFCHYYGLAKKTFFKIDFSGEINSKKWLYFFRAVLAADWVGKGKGIPPMTLAALMADLPPTMIALVEQFIAAKAQQSEKNAQPLPAELISFSQQLWQQVGEYAFPKINTLSPTTLDQYFQQTLIRLANEPNH